MQFVCLLFNFAEKLMNMTQSTMTHTNSGEGGNALIGKANHNKTKFSRRLHRMIKVFAVIAVLILIKWLWVSVAMNGIGTVDGEKGTILRRRNYLASKVVTTPEQVLQNMPADIGEQFRGEWAIFRICLSQ